MSKYKHLGAGKVVLDSEHQYLTKYHPNGNTDIENGKVNGFELGSGPFNWQKAKFAHNAKILAISIELPNGKWSRPMVADMFEAAE